jgi:PEP-CTERM motif
MRFVCLIVLTVIGMWLVSPAHAIRIDFEEPGLGIVNGVTSQTTGLDSRGFHFSTNMDVVDITSPGTPWPHGPARSGLFAILNNYGGDAVITKNGGGTFTFQHLYIHAWLPDWIGESVTVRGFLGATEVGMVTGTIGDWWTLIDGNFDNSLVDSLIVHSYSFLLDDIRLDGINDPIEPPVLRPAPEPTTMVVLATGLLGIGFMRRQRRSGNRGQSGIC